MEGWGGSKVFKLSIYNSIPIIPYTVVMPYHLHKHTDIFNRLDSDRYTTHVKQSVSAQVLCVPLKSPLNYGGVNGHLWFNKILREILLDQWIKLVYSNVNYLEGGNQFKHPYFTCNKIIIRAKISLFHTDWSNFDIFGCFPLLVFSEKINGSNWWIG